MIMKKYYDISFNLQMYFQRHCVVISKKTNLKRTSIHRSDFSWNIHKTFMDTETIFFYQNMAKLCLLIGNFLKVFSVKDKCCLFPIYT